MTGLILGIYNSDGVIVARYVYDAFGNHKVCDGYYNDNTNDSFIGNINSFRYKSYYYDKESNLYYLNSRYYSPIYYRFISIDDIDYLKSERINGINLYAYCGNDPVNYTDSSGHMPILCTLLFLGGLGALTAIASQAVTDIIYGNEFAINNYLIAAGAGFLGGLCYAIPGVGGILAGAVTSGLTTAGQMIYSGEDFTVADYVINIGMSAVIGGVTSWAFGKATSNISYFADTDFFLSNLVKFAGNYGGITLENSVINQLMGQLIVRGVITGIISTIFGSIFQDIPSKTRDYYHLREMGLDPWNSFKYAYF
ncbi:MAG: RHS repeat-associated core domain-containing protein [Candidatus Caccosoma sp.]|nr:RHS repeat-associated core domain-containing protein [Candidatus Caccosoma sp.]